MSGSYHNYETDERQMNWPLNTSISLCGRHHGRYLSRPRITSVLAPVVLHKHSEANMIEITSEGLPTALLLQNFYPRAYQNTSCLTPDTAFPVQPITFAAEQSAARRGVA